MNKLTKLLTDKKELLSIYYTAGFPTKESTGDIALKLEEEGADIIELGMPYSDPVADGPVIQNSNKIALDNGMSVHLLFQQLSEFSDKITIPVILMGYINPVLQYGLENFLKKCQEHKISALILPDLPLEVYQKECSTLFEKYNIPLIFLISPNTPEERIRKIDSMVAPFVYMVSSSSITGKEGGFSEEQIAYFKRIDSLNLKTPRMIGFGISNAATFESVCQYSRGAIIGSAFIRQLEKSTEEKDIQNFIHQFRKK